MGVGAGGLMLTQTGLTGENITGMGDLRSAEEVAEEVDEHCQHT